MWRRLSVLLSMLAIAAVGNACSLHEGSAPSISDNEPGMAAWKGDVACKADSDCLAGEACSEGVCQMKRCAEASSYRSAPPLGKNAILLLQRELVAASASTIQGYSPRDRTFVRPRNFAPWTTGSAVSAVAGGNFFGSRPEAVAAATAGSDEVVVHQGNKSKPMSLGLQPIALASGDTDGDGIDELLAADAGGNFALCHVDSGKCTRASLGASGVVDAAMGDVDGDGLAEAVFAIADRLVIYDFQKNEKGKNEVTEVAAGKTSFRIATGDLDGDRIAEIIGLEDGGMWFWNHDAVNVFSFKGGKLSKGPTAEVPRGALDLTVVHAGNERGQLAVLGDANAVSVMALAGDGALSTSYTSTLAVSEPVTRLATADVDGNSPSGRLRGEAELVAGTTTPIAVLGLPPYSKTYSSGRSGVSVGAEESKSESVASTVALTLGVTVSADFKVSEFFKVGVSGRVSATSAHTDVVTTSLSVGQSFQMEAMPELEGFDAGAVVLGCGCFHKYDYLIEDPDGLLAEGGDGKTISVFIPVGGQTQLWSTRRYNALAKAIGTLPEVKMPYRLGEVDSYPKRAETLSGKPVAPEDMLFSEPPSFRTSDVGNVSFSLNQSQSKANIDAFTYSYGGSVTVGGGVSFVSASLTVDASKAVTSAYTVSVGRSTSFSGWTSPIRNDTGTPEDEFALNSFSFTPYVYRQRYKAADDANAALFVLMYAVGR